MQLARRLILMLMDIWSIYICIVLINADVVWGSIFTVCAFTIYHKSGAGKTWFHNEAKNDFDVDTIKKLLESHSTLKHVTVISNIHFDGDFYTITLKSETFESKSKNRSFKKASINAINKLSSDMSKLKC